MNSRMSFGGGFSILQAKENQIAGSWTPVTSEKPVHSRSHFIPVERYGNQFGGGFSIPQNQYTDYRIPERSEKPVPSRSHMIPVERYGNQFGGGLSIPENHITGSWIPVTSEKPVPSRSHLIPVETNGSQFGGGFSIPQNQNTGSRTPVTSEKPIPSRSHMIPVERYGSQFGGGFSILENQIAGSWIPVTPGKPIPTRPHLIPAERYGNGLERADWQELGGFPNGHIQEAVQNFNSMGQVGRSGEFYGGNVELTDRNQMINHIAGSYAQQLNNVREGWDTNLLTNLLARKNAASHSTANRTPKVVNRSLTPNLHSQVDGIWSTTGSGSSLLANQDHYLGSNLQSIGDSLPHIPQNGFPIPYEPSFNLNSPPRAEANTSSSVTNSFQLAPVTPDPTKKLENNQLYAILNLSTDEIICHEKDKQNNLATPIGNEVNQYHFDELLQNIVDSSSAAIYTTVTGKKDSDRGDQGIDLNKTPEQKPPKRRKHRPKVIVEGKPKRPTKPATNRSSDSKENPSGKRKYVCRKGMKESASQLADVTKETTNPNAETSTKSCKRALNFDLETIGDEGRGKENDQQKMKRRIEQPFNLNLDYQVTESCIGTESVHERNSATQIGLQNEFRLENQQLASANNLIHYSNQMPTGYISVPERQVAAAQVATMKDKQIINLNVIAKTIDVGNVAASQNCSKKRYTTLVQHNHAEGIKQTVFQEKTSHVNLERTRQLMSPSTTQSAPKILPNSKEARGSKKGYRHTIEQTNACTVNHGGSSLLRQEVLHVEECYRNDSSPGSGFSENHKKRKTDDGLLNTCSLPRLKAVEDGPIQAKRKGAVDVKANDCMSEMNHEILNCYLERTNTSKRLNNEVGKFAGDWYNHSMAAACDLLKQHVSSEPHSCSERHGETDRLTQIGNFVSQTTVENCNLLPPSTPKNIPAPGNRKVVKSCRTNISAKKHTVRPNLPKSISIGTDKVLQEHDTLCDYQTFAAKTRGQPGTQKYPIPFFDKVINRMKALNINGKSNNIEGHEHMAIVPVKNDGTVVLHEVVMKKRKPRPKVDLDPETDRIWKLLMGKEASEDDEVTDKEKEKWWEEERIVFQGRADSFIARMHLVQGDRRFSRWKGSVVDSVIGVFLTQNVSDHLSSSAFMSLAARFPIRSTTNNKACDKNATTILIEESEVCILNPEEAIEWHETTSGQLVCNQQSTWPHASREHQGGSGTRDTERTSLEEANSKRMEEEVISSQDSYDPTVDQGNRGIRSYSGSNSEAEDPTPWRKPNKIHGSTSTNLLHLERTSLFQEFYSLLNGCSLFDDRCKHGHKQLEDIEHCWQNPRPDGADNLKCSSTFNFLNDINNSQMQVPAVPSRNYQLKNTPASGLLEAEGYEMFGEESISSWPSTASGIAKEIDTNCMSNRIGQLAESVGETVHQQNGVPRSKETARLDPYALFTLHQESTSQPEHHTKYNQASYYSHQHERNKSSLESMSVTEPVKYAKAAERQNRTLQHIPNAPKVTEKAFDVEERICAENKEICLGNKLVKPKSKEHVDSSGKEYIEKKTNVSKAKRGKAEGEKKNAVDWDNLRKQVPTDGGIKERSKDTEDSLNYEAMRCANVNEISEAIKERGMNNMLAERMKEFLNRLVRDHGNIDLEWLRNVSPEKAKDYLLSIRGLGLKSVECVRLLTLHHLAFPVDTNVGRIAVRLGWVPLQPLPESLQIHLLELYPMLESIQKYLWPRLCKLDQRTLYELHYQMITFGKVFCTKNKPNCNACPMRGECKHFASAFASARLALPGPEARSVVSSTIPISANRNSAVVINPARVPLLVNGSVKETAPKFGQCEPIIEEPATPEQEIMEITESDTEDAFYEDPDEIPTIKLSPEEFTANLQGYMQENMDLQDIDMSKALVALSREAASIPIPKLKNVNQLRTEHLVYELPDTHLLLKGMDRREPDDPSPYLLAIWTPGETANSIQLPERRCVAQKAGKLCSDKTCSSCNSIRDANLQIVRGTILIPCRTAMRGSFPLNGTYFQVNEVFADHDSSLSPIEVPRAWIWNLPRRTVYFGTSVSTIFKGLSTEGIQYCFWRGFVCVRGFDRTSRAPRPLIARLHFPASKLAKKKNENR